MTTLAPPSQSPADSLVRTPAVPPSDLGKRVARLMLLRTLVVTVVLGLSLWLLATGQTPQRVAMFLQLAVIVATYVSSIVFGVLLRRGFAPKRVARPMHANDLVLTSALVYITGGALSPYMFLYALSIVSAGALSYRRGAVTVAAASLALATAVSLFAWAHVIDLPLTGSVQPWEQSGLELVR